MKVKISEKIKNLRKQAKLSQEELAEQLHVSRQTVFKWESGKSIPDTDNVVLMSKLFGVPLEELLYDELELRDVSERISVSNTEEAQAMVEESEMRDEKACADQLPLEEEPECLKKRQRQLLLSVVINLIYVLAVCIYFMIVRWSWKIRLEFILPTVIGSLFFTGATLGLYLNYKKESKYEQKIGLKRFYILIIIGLVFYGGCTLIAGDVFLSQFPHFEPAGFWGIFFFIAVYPIQLFVPFVLLRGAVSAFPFNRQREADKIASIKREATGALISAGSCFLCMNGFYRIKAATGAFDWAYSENISVLWNYLDKILLVSFVITVLFILPCVSLIRACGRWGKYNMPFKKGRFRFLSFSAMLYLTLVFIGNWITFDMFYEGNFFSILLGVIINVIFPLMAILQIFFVCEKYKN